MDKKKIFKKIILLILLVVCLFLLVCLIIPQKKANADTYQSDTYYEYINNYSTTQTYTDGIYLNLSTCNDSTFAFGLSNTGAPELFLTLYDINNVAYHLLYYNSFEYFTDCVFKLHNTTYQNNFSHDIVLKSLSDNSLIQYLSFGVKLRYGSHTLANRFQTQIIDNVYSFRGINIITQSAYDNMYNRGYGDGEHDGYQDGYSGGVADGNRQGYTSGYNDGLSANVDSAMRDTLATWDGFIPSLFGSVAAFINSTLGNITIFGVSGLTILITFVVFILLFAVFKIFNK